MNEISCQKSDCSIIRKVHYPTKFVFLLVRIREILLYLNQNVLSFILNNIKYQNCTDASSQRSFSILKFLSSLFFFLIYRNESSHGSFLIRAYASSCRAGFTRCRRATRANLVFTCAHVDDGRGWTRVSSFFSAVRVRELAFPGLT